MASEKSLLDIWSVALPRLRANRFNQWLSYSGIVFGFAIGIIFEPTGFVEKIHDLSGALASIWAGLLGFVIAGYAVFTTMMDKSLALALWQIEDEVSKFPHLKVRLLTFVRLFIVLALGFALHLLLFIVSSLVPSPPCLSPAMRLLAKCVILSAVCFGVTSALVELKALIFNLYDFVITQVRKLEIDAKKGGK